MDYILALDQGTTSSRALVFDSNCCIVSIAQQELSLLTPEPNWVELCPMQLWETQLATAKLALAKANIATEDLRCIGIANQRETTIIWHKKTGKPIANALVWQDSRTDSFCQQLIAQGHNQTIHSKTGLTLAPYFSASKIKWLLDNTPNARTQALAGELAFGTVDSWLLWQLTEGKTHSIEATNASRTLLMNLHTQQWDPELLALFDIPASILPTISASAGELGMATALGLARSVPITGILGDQQAALLGQGCLDKGQAKNTYGTGCFMLVNTDNTAQLSKHSLLTTLAWSIPTNLSSCTDFYTQYALEGSVFMGGAIIKWLRDNLGIISHAAEIETLAKTVSSSEGVYMIPAFTGLGAPYWNTSISASINGLTRGSHKGHIARAALDAIAFQVTDLVEAMQEDIGTAFSSLKVDGGAANCDLLLTIQANCLHIPIHRPQSTETTALGAALIAGIGQRLFTNKSQIQAFCSAEQTFNSQPQHSQTSQYVQWRTAIITEIGQSRR